MAIRTAPATAELSGGVGRSPRFASLARREAMLAYALMLPGALVLILFMAYPFFLGIWLSLTDKRVGRAAYDFVGLDNYRWYWHDEIFRQTVKNTFIYGFGTVPFKLMLGLGLALLLNERFRGSRFARAGLLLPWIVPTAISSLAWLMIFDPFLSPISLALKDWGLISGNINFLGTPWHARASLCLANVWRGIPFFAISILAGLQAVPDDLHEAAALDGANAWQRFWSVTYPVIRNIVLITTLFSIIWTFADFQLIYVITKGAPLNSTHVFGTYSYDQMRVGYLGDAATISLYMFPILSVFAIIMLRFVRKED
ncbi:MAG TPA: sugar ABC transporter permease [Thermomicrobiales bacterium]|nr:sugar ABC transporter permease [Thermomicrobiales bacterium]